MKMEAQSVLNDALSISLHIVSSDHNVVSCRDIRRRLSGCKFKQLSLCVIPHCSAHGTGHMQLYQTVLLIQCACAE